MLTAPTHKPDIEMYSMQLDTPMGQSTNQTINKWLSQSIKMHATTGIVKTTCAVSLDLECNNALLEMLAVDQE